MNRLTHKLCTLALTALPAAGGPQLQHQRTDSPPACAEAAPEEFVVWAREHATALASVDWSENHRDLLPLRNIVGDARVVGLGESARRVHEFYGVRASMFDSWLRIWASLRWRWRPASQKPLASMIIWMRQYNLEPRHTRKIHFYGVDSMVVYSSLETAKLSNIARSREAKIAPGMSPESSSFPGYTVAAASRYSVSNCLAAIAN